MCAESAPDLIEVSSVDIDADDSSDGRVIDVFESVTAGNAQHGHTIRDADVQRAFEQLREHTQLLCIVPTHVAFVVLQRNREPGIVHRSFLVAKGIGPTILRKKIEDLRQVRASMSIANKHTGTGVPLRAWRERTRGHHCPPPTA